jgi:hypothetical protein
MGFEATSTHDPLSQDMDKGPGSIRQKICQSDEFAARILMAKLHSDSKDKIMSPAQWAKPQQPAAVESLHWTYSHPIAMQVAKRYFYHDELRINSCSFFRWREPP